MKKETNNKPINEGAEYIALKVKDKNILVDMYDILDIIKSATQTYLKDGAPITIDIYDIIYKDGLRWTLPIEEETLKRYENFKKNLDKKK